MSDTTVSVSQGAIQQVAQLRSQVNGNLKGSLDTVTKLANNLAADQSWRGPYATQYKTQTYPAIQKATAKMHTDLDQLSQALNKIMANIMAAGGVK